MNNFFLSFVLLTFSLTGIAQSSDSDTIGNQRAWYACGNQSEIDSSKINLKEGQVYFDFRIDEVPDSTDGIRSFWLKNSPNSYFLSYLVNTTDEVFIADRQDGSLMMIQEALDEDGNWRPIEYWVRSGCGNSYFDPLKLEPGQSIVVPIRRYTGDFKTQIRLRFQVGRKDILLTDSFDASIDVTQFVQEKNNVRGILFNGPANYFKTKEDN